MTTSESTSPGPLPERAALEAAVRGAAGPQAAVRELLGERQLWWRCCSEAALADPAWLFDGRGEELRAWIDATVPDRAAAGALPPTEHAWLLGRALSAPADRVAEHAGPLARLVEDWDRSGLVSAEAAPAPAQPSGKGLDGLSPRVAVGLRAVVERIGGGESAAAQAVLVIAALLMAGVKPRRRPVVSVPVVFGRSAGPAGRDAVAEGATGVLELREFPAGPAGLYPDPRAMAGVRSPNAQFAGALGRAWQAAGSRSEGRCVLWRLVLADEPMPPARIEGPSLGAAFALGLRELLRHPPSGRPGLARLRGVFRGLRPRTAVTGVLDGGDRLLKVSDLDAKLLAARRKGLRLVAPEANRLDVATAPEPGDVRFAATLRQADRYARRYRTGRLAVALSLVAAAATAGVVVQQQDAAAVRRLTTAHRLADVSQSLLGSDVGLAELFAVQAYRYHPDTLTRTALFQAVTASPHLVGSAQASGAVSALSGSGDGRAVLAGTQQGEVEQWAVDGTALGPARRLGRLPGAVDAVAEDADGGTVAAINRGAVGVWSAGRPAAAPAIPSGQQPTAVGISPSGRFVAVATSTEIFGMPPVLWVLDRSTGRTGRLDLKGMNADPTGVALPDDSAAVVFEDGYGGWQRISLAGLTRTAEGEVGFGVHNRASALAPDGSYFTYTNGASGLRIWPSHGSPTYDTFALQAQVQPGMPAALALSRGGASAAEAVGTSIYVSPTTTAAGGTPDAPAVLPGAGTVSRRALAFLGSGSDRLLSASGDVLSLWDLGQSSRIAAEAPAAIPYSCNGCLGPRIALSPDGRSAAVASGDGTALDVQRLDPPGAGRQSVQEPLLADPQYTAALWQGDGKGVIALSPGDGSAQILSIAHGLRPVGRWRPVPNPLQLPDAASLLRLLPGGGQVAEVDGSGTIRFRDAATGRVVRQLDGPRDMAPTVNSDRPLPQGSVALDASAAHAAVIDSVTSRVQVTDTATGSSRTIPGGNAAGIAYAGDRLLVQRQGGDLEIWTASGDRRLGTLKGTAGIAVGPVVGMDGTDGADGIVAEKPNEDTVQLIDLQSGDPLGALPLPPGLKAVSTGMAFSADGTELVTATEAYGDAGHGLGRLILWRLDPGAEIRAACASVGRKLTADDWRQYLGTGAPASLDCS